MNDFVIFSSKCFFDIGSEVNQLANEMELNDKEWQLAHGKSTFMKPERVAKLVRENTGGGTPA